MKQQDREKLYNNFKVKSKDINELYTIFLDLTKSYNYNKRKILELLPNTLSTAYKGKKYHKSQGGVWYLYSIVNKEKVVYDICETSSIIQEMITYLYYLYCGKKDVRKNIYKTYTRKVYTKYKTQQIYKSLKKKTIYFGVLMFEDNKQKKLKAELDFAVLTKAKFWSPNPSQLKEIGGIIEL